MRAMKGCHATEVRSAGDRFNTEPVGEVPALSKFHRLGPKMHGGLILAYGHPYHKYSQSSHNFLSLF